MSNLFLFIFMQILYAKPQQCATICAVEFLISHPVTRTLAGNILVLNVVFIKERFSI